MLNNVDESMIESKMTNISKISARMELEKFRLELVKELLDLNVLQKFCWLTLEKFNFPLYALMNVKRISNSKVNEKNKLGVTVEEHSSEI